MDDELSQSQSLLTGSHLSGVEEQRSEEKSVAPRRGAAFGDDIITMILAGRQSNATVGVPHLPHSASRPACLIMSDADFDHVMGEANGNRYGSGCRPELEIVVVKLKGDPDPDLHEFMKKAPAIPIPRLRQSVEAVPGEIAPELSQTTTGTDDDAVKEELVSALSHVQESLKAQPPPRCAALLFDASRNLFVYSRTVEYRLLQMLAISESKADDSVGLEPIQEEEADPATAARGVDCLEAALWFSVLQFQPTHTMDLVRKRCWRRFLRVHIQPIYSSTQRMRASEEAIVRQAEDQLRARIAAMDYSDTDSSVSGFTQHTEAAEREKREREKRERDAQALRDKEKHEADEARKRKEDEDRTKKGSKVAAHKQLVKGISKRGLATK